VSILALNGIWHLMQRHNLDYPDFYPKLYSLLSHETLNAPYRHLFFQKLDMFLSSASLASYAAAAFAKRCVLACVRVVAWLRGCVRVAVWCCFVDEVQNLDSTSLASCASGWRRPALPTLPCFLEVFTRTL
jgi:hypothetical protein